MIILGIETSCDETSMAVLEVDKKEKARILSNVISSQVKIHAKYGGVYPALAAREHAKNIDKVLKLTLKEAGLKSVEEIDLIAVTAGPGLAVALIVGITFAKTLAWKYKKPIVGVNHLEGHIYSNWLNNQTGKSSIRPTLDPRLIAREFSSVCIADLPVFPVLNLIVSGGHTELVLMKNHGQYKIIGETLDDAAGEAFDKIARMLELGYPGGPLISAEAEKYQPATNNPPLITKLPRPMINSKDFNFSFSGLKTAVLYLVKDLLKKHSLDEIRPAVAHEAQQAIVDVLVSKTLRAAKDYQVKSVLLSGGVSANALLRLSLNRAVTKLGIKYSQPLMAYTTDNAAMIALAGYFNYSKKSRQRKTDWQSVEVDANLRI